ncbi:MAG TPA: GNAT family N-acetyltransferase [Phycisphaerae bacterium]|nr:GNAT family N-acetyltransferase [Phycisphaerae bacterium]
MPEITLIERRLAVEEYLELRRAVGWWEVEPEAVRAGLPNDQYTIVAESGGQTIGCGRIIGDGGIYFYIQDVIVLPAYQGQGVGRRIMDRLMEFLTGRSRPKCFVGLMAAAGVQAFYERYGFVRRSGDRPGMYLRWPTQQPGVVTE